MAHSTIFKTNRSQAVRLPKAVAFPDHVGEVEIIKLGQSRLIVPVELCSDDFFRNGPSVSEDFMQDREHPPPRGESSFDAAIHARYEHLFMYSRSARSSDVLPFSASAASHYGQIRVALEGAGRPIGAHDMLIGAHARSEGMTVVTNNLREFERIPELRTENWV